MGLKEFLQEEKEARKQRKLQKKLEKKSPLTKEQKYYKIAGVIVGILVTFGAIFNACSSCSGDYDWKALVGITDEMIDELEKPVDENLLFSSGKIALEDLESCKEKLKDANANVFEDVEELFASKTFSLNSKEIGALTKELFQESEQTLSIDLLDFEIYFKDDYYYEKSITKLDLKKIVNSDNLPVVYLQSVSKIEVLGGEICILNTEFKINQIEESVNKSIVDILDNYTNFDLAETTNSLINMTINLFAGNINTSIKLKENGIEFRI